MWDLAFVGRDIGGTTVWGQRVRVVVVVVVGVVCTVQFNTVDAITVDAILLLPFDAMWTILFTHNVFCSTTSPLRLCSASWICTWGTGTKGQLGLGSGGKDLMGNPTGPVMFTTRPMIIEEFRQDITVRVCWCRPVNVGVLL